MGLQRVQGRFEVMVSNIDVLFDKKVNIGAVKSLLNKYDGSFSVKLIRELRCATHGKILDEASALRHLLTNTLVSIPVVINSNGKVVIEITLDGVVVILGRKYTRLDSTQYVNFLSYVGFDETVASLVWSELQSANTKLLYPVVSKFETFKRWISGFTSKRDHIVKLLGLDLLHRSPPSYIKFIAGETVSSTLANEELYQYYYCGIISSNEYSNLVYSLRATYVNSPSLVVTL